MKLSRSPKTIFFLFFIFISTSFAQNSQIREQIKALTTKGHVHRLSYSAARHYMFTKIHMRKNSQGQYYVRDVYCHRNVLTRINSEPDHKNVNCEHTWPRSRFNKSISKSLQESDIHHLYPTDSKANSKRGSWLFTDFVNDRPLSGCSTSMYGKSASGVPAFEPPNEHKGNVARALFYFSVRYDIPIPDIEEIHLRRWNRLDPVDAEEMRRNNLVQKAQGNRNPFIDRADLADKLRNF